MRFQQLLPLLPLASAFVITEESVFQGLEKLERAGKSTLEKSQNLLDEITRETSSALDTALEEAAKTFNGVKEEAYHKIHDTGVDVNTWLEGLRETYEADADDDTSPEDKPHRKPHHGHGHGKPNRTVYELINESKYTTKLAKFINEYDDLVEALNGTKANYTIFAPTDEAFEKIPEHAHKPSKETLKKVLLYHVSDDFYPAGRVLGSYTIPTLFEPEEFLGHKQRLTVRGTLRGPALNYYSRIIAVNIFGTNGVIHGVDSILIPPPSVATVLDLLPGEFSTLELGLTKTGLYEKINSTKYPHEGGTLFAPSNFAFKKLGPKVNAFLFSRWGVKYLNALLKYHIVVNQTLYTDAFYDASNQGDSVSESRNLHLDLPTALHGKNLAVDVTRFGPFVEIRINAFSRVTVHDFVSSDGVIQVVGDVLIPPKTPGGEAEKAGEMTVDEFKARFEGLVDDDAMEL